MTVDLSPIISALVPADIVGAILSVAAVLAAVYVVCFAVIATLVTLRGGSVSDQIRFLDLMFQQNKFKTRYRREIKNKQYRQWKKSRKD